MVLELDAQSLVFYTIQAIHRGLEPCESANELLKRLGARHVPQEGDTSGTAGRQPGA